MKIFLILFLSLLSVAIWQNQMDADLPIEVVKFSWSRNGPAARDDHRIGSANPARREFDYLREMANRSSIEERSRDMRELEESVLRERAPTKPITVYRYKIELRNRGTKVIKWFFFDYQTTAASDPANPSHREFACAVKMKPNDNQSLVAESLLPPSRVIHAAGKEAAPTEKLIINRIEYADGAFWQRPGWHPPDQFPSRSSGRGPCRPL